jgi:hypothetical protein
VFTALSITSSVRASGKSGITAITSRVCPGFPSFPQEPKELPSSSRCFLLTPPAGGLFLVGIVPALLVFFFADAGKNDRELANADSRDGFASWRGPTQNFSVTLTL